MKGWKTKVGAVGVMLTGAGLIIAGLLAEPMGGEQLAAGLLMIFGAFEGLGIAHKIEKSGQP